MSSGAVGHALQSSDLSCQLFRTLRPELKTGYFTILTSCLQFLLAVCFMVTGLLEALLYEREISGLILAFFGILLGILFIQHVFSWHYNSMLALLSHTASCAVIGTAVFLFVLILLFCDIHNMEVLGHMGFRRYVHVFLIEALLTLPLFFMFGLTTWSRAVEINKFVEDAAVFIVTLENLEKLTSDALKLNERESPQGEIQQIAN